MSTPYCDQPKECSCEGTKSNADAQLKVEAYMYFPTWIFAVAVGVALALTGFVGYALYELPFELHIAYVLVALCAIAAAGIFHFCSMLVRARFAPVNDWGIEIMKSFRFNRPGEDHLRSVVAQRGAVRTIDLEKALRLHFEHEGAMEQEALNQRRNDAASRFTGQA